MTLMHETYYVTHFSDDGMQMMVETIICTNNTLLNLVWTHQDSRWRRLRQDLNCH